MKTKVRYLIIFVCMIMALGALGGCAKQKAPEGPTTISTADRAMAVIEVQNTFSKHAYYHAAGLHLEELADLWVKEDGEYAKTATWTNPQGIQEGMALIKKNYGTDQLEKKKKILEQMSQIYPELKNVPENIGAGYEWAMHTQTTPIIEIAGDGKTAKGVWYSPGISVGGTINEGKVNVRGGWFWEKYGVDFVKEDGKWKIWHIGTYYDNTPPGWGGTEGQTAQAGPAPAGAKPGATPAELEKIPTIGGLEMTRENPDPYKAWSPTTVPMIQPRFPEPYYTFSETFSY